MTFIYHENRDFRPVPVDSGWVIQEIAYYDEDGGTPAHHTHALAGWLIQAEMRDPENFQPPEDTGGRRVEPAVWCHYDGLQSLSEVNEVGNVVAYLTRDDGLLPSDAFDELDRKMRRHRRGTA